MCSEVWMGYSYVEIVWDTSEVSSVVAGVGLRVGAGGEELQPLQKRRCEQEDLVPSQQLAHAVALRPVKHYLELASTCSLLINDHCPSTCPEVLIDRCLADAVRDEAV